MFSFDLDIIPYQDCNSLCHEVIATSIIAGFKQYHPDSTWALVIDGITGKHPGSECIIKETIPQHMSGKPAERYIEIRGEHLQVAAIAVDLTRALCFGP